MNAITHVIIGFLLCAWGVYLFNRRAFEENKRVLEPVILIIAGVIMLGFGFAKFYGVLPPDY